MLAFLLSIADERYYGKVKAIYDSYHEEMYKIAISILKDRSDCSEQAEEALQNAFVKIIEHIDSIDFETSEDIRRSYYYTIITNEARTIRDRRVRTVSLKESVDDIDDNDFFASIGIMEDYEKVVAAISELDDIYSIPLRLRYVEEMSVKEISKLLGQNVHTVYSHINRGKIILRKKLGGEIKGYE